MLSYSSFSSSRPCQFDKSIAVKFLSESDFEYEIFQTLFDEYGFAISMLKQNLIVFDKKTIDELQITPDEVDFIESHEYSHFKLGEGAKEIDCDWLGIATLWRNGNRFSAKVGVDLFEERNGMGFDTSDLEGYDKWVNICENDSKKFLEECEKKGLEPIKILKDLDKYVDHMETVDRFNKKHIIAYAWNMYIDSIIK